MGALLRVLGIDPGTHRMGVGILASSNAEVTVVYTGVLAPEKGNPLANRLCYLFLHLSEIIDKFSPDEVAIEEPFASRNIRTAMAIGQAQAVAMVAAAQHKLPISSYAPRRVKQSVTDHGGSSKIQVQEMVAVLLGLDTLPDSFDAADALAVAICHINSTEVEGSGY